MEQHLVYSVKLWTVGCTRSCNISLRNWGINDMHLATLIRAHTSEPSFLSLLRALSLVLMLCAPCFLLSASCLSGFLVTARQARSMTRVTLPRRSPRRNSGLFVAHGQAESTKHEH
jgi:hypothetical protein